jgi:hypothetical protein
VRISAGRILRYADLREASLSEANLSEANLSRANLDAANLGQANLGAANLGQANLGGAYLIRANLSGAGLVSATLVDTDLTGADLTGCRIFGISAWRLKLEGAKQQNLVITSGDEPEITVDNIEVAQLIYLLLHNEKIREVIDTIGKFEDLNSPWPRRLTPLAGAARRAAAARQDAGCPRRRNQTPTCATSTCNRSKTAKCD